MPGFQCPEAASGDVATPASPKAPALASGAIVKNGTAVVITRLDVSWPAIIAVPCPYENDTVKKVNAVKPAIGKWVKEATKKGYYGLLKGDEFIRALLKK